MLGNVLLDCLESSSSNGDDAKLAFQVLRHNRCNGAVANYIFDLSSPLQLSNVPLPAKIGSTDSHGSFEVAPSNNLPQ